MLGQRVEVVERLELYSGRYRVTLKELRIGDGGQFFKWSPQSSVFTLQAETGKQGFPVD